MKKIIAIALALMLCVGVLSVSAFAAFDNVESLAVVGTGIPGVPEWKPEAPEGDMEMVSAGIYEKTLVMTAGTTMKFKVAGNDKWDDTCNFGSATIVLGEVAELTCSGGSSDMPFTAEKDMTIKIKVDLTGDVATILVTEVGAEPETPADPETPDEPAKLGNYFVTGGAAKDTTSDGSWLSNWTVKNDAGQMTDLGGGKYQKVFKDVPAGAYELKVNDGTWNNSWGGDGENGNYYFSVSETCDVTVTFTLNGNEGTVSVTGAGVPGTADFSIISVVVLMVLAATTTVVLVTNKKKLF